MTQREAERRRAAAVHEATLAEIGRENMEKHREFDAEYASRMADNEADLAKARKEWREAVDAAKIPGSRKDDGSELPGVEGPDDIINKARDVLAGLGDNADA